jgi:hypothetical protein
VKTSTSKEPRFRFFALPPERGSRSVILAGGCCTTCCCCCCCLHVVGGLIGAAITAAAPTQAATYPVRYAKAAYWKSLLYCTVLAVLLASAAGGYWWGIGVLFVGLPLVQLLASLLAILLLDGQRRGLRPPDLSLAKRTIGLIAWRGVLGALLGLLPLLLLILILFPGLINVK